LLAQHAAIFPDRQIALAGVAGRGPRLLDLWPALLERPYGRFGDPGATLIRRD
jgi:hypothetical protein